MAIDQIIPEVSKISAELRKKEKKKNPWSRIADIDHVYVKAAEKYLDLKVHVEDGFFPENLFKEKAPFQDDLEYKWLKKNYRSITNIVPGELFSVINRIFNENNFSVEWREKGIREDESVKKYFDEQFPIYGSVFSFYKKNVTKKQIADPNGVLAIKPYRPPIKEDGSIDQTQRLRPLGYYYTTIDTVLFIQDELAVILTPKKTLLNGETIPTGYVFEVYTTEWIYELRQKGDQSKNAYDIVEIYKHDLGELPVRELGTDVEIIDGQIFLHSPIEGVVAPLDSAALDNSTLDLVKGKCAYPIKIAPEEPCDYDGCVDGKVFEDGEEVTCKRCNGTGNLHSDSPATTYRVRQPRGTEIGKSVKEMFMSPPIQFVAPDTEILEFLDHQIDKNLDKARSIAKLKKTETKGNDLSTKTATGEAIDRDDHFSFIKGISDAAFDLLEWQIKITGKMRYGDKFEMPSISRPSEFSIRTAADITEEISAAKEGGVPSIFVENLIKEALDKRFNFDQINQHIIDLQIEADSLVTSSENEINLKIAQRRLSKWEIVLHDRYMQIVREIVAEDPKFFEKEMRVQQEKVIEVAKLKASEIEGATEIANEAGNVDIE